MSKLLRSVNYAVAELARGRHLLVQVDGEVAFHDPDRDGFQFKTTSGFVGFVSGIEASRGPQELVAAVQRELDKAKGQAS